MKTLDEMFAYAKNIVDNDENANVLFLFKTWDDLLKYRSVCTKKYIAVYESKGILRLAVLPLSHKEGWQLVAGMQLTHVFCQGYPSAEVRGMLSSRLRSFIKTKEPMGFYYDGWVERYTDY